MENYDFQRRVLMCGNCGAPLETGFAGGTVKCDYCGTSNHFMPRRDEPVEPLEAAVEIDEATRMEMLRMQDGRQPEVPQELKPLLSGGQLAPWKVGEALSLWSSTCRNLARSSDYSDSELLYYLTIVLSNHYSSSRDELRERALYESALEVMTLPRHRQIIRGFLARNAALEGDTEAARKWLAPCNPRSEDLETDSSYRISMADILTVEKDWDGVLGILGTDIDSVPVTSALDGKAIVQRANALEHLGRTGEAAGQLHLFMQANGSIGLGALRSIRGVYAESGLDVCPGSMAAAEAMFDEGRGRAAAGLKNPGCFGQTFMLAGLSLMGLGIAIEPLLGSAGARPPAVVRITLIAMGAVFLLVGILSIRAGRRAFRLATEGIEAGARVLSVQPTGWRVNEVPQYALQIRVEMEGREPYQASCKVLLGDAEKERYAPGSQITVKVDPDEPSRVSVID